MRLSCLVLVPALLTLGPVAFADPADEDPAPVYSPPHVVPYAGGSIPSNAHLEERPNMTLIQLGLWSLGLTYGGSLLYAVETCSAQMACRPGSNWLYLPVVGPFVTAAMAPTTGGQALSVFDGVVQTAGAVLLIVGLEMPKQVVVWQDSQVEASLRVAPVAGGAQVMLSLDGLARSAQ